MSDRIIELLSKYGERKFKDDWWPGNAEPHIGEAGAELEELLENGYEGRVDRVVSLLNAYGEAKFGDDWWPGNARPWIGDKLGAELETLLGCDTPEAQLETNLSSSVAAEDSKSTVRVTKSLDIRHKIMPARGVEGEYLGRDERGVAVRVRLPFPTARGGTAHPFGGSTHTIVYLPQDAIEVVTPDAEFPMTEDEPVIPTPTLG